MTRLEIFLAFDVYSCLKFEYCSDVLIVTLIMRNSTVQEDSLVKQSSIWCEFEVGETGTMRKPVGARFLTHY